MTAPQVSPREVRDSDPPLFFTYVADPEACRTAAFTSEDPTDRHAFDAHWARVLEKCGFAVTGQDRAFSSVRGEETDEVLFTLTG